MAGEMTIEVPITIKGGNEGNKVGVQIGNKVAGQLEKAFKSINLGGGVQAETSRSLKVSAVKLGAIGVSIGGVTALLRKSSPYLKGMLDILGRSFLIFFRPFGDFLATLLRPLAIVLMKFAVAFSKWFKEASPGEKAAAVTVVTVGGIVTAAAIGTLASQAAAILGIGTAASTATGQVSTFMSKLKLLAGIGLITIGVALAYDVMAKEGFEAEDLLKTLGAGLALGLGATLLGASVAAGITIGIITVTAILAWKYVQKDAQEMKQWRTMGGAAPGGFTDIQQKELDAMGISKSTYEGGSRMGMPTPPKDYPGIDYSQLKYGDQSSSKIITVNQNVSIGSIKSDTEYTQLIQQMEDGLKERGAL